MRWIIYFLSVYFLILSGLPCSDSVEKDYVEAALSSSDTCHNCEVCCSPLCLCAHGSGFTLYQLTSSLSTTTPFLKPVASLYLQFPVLNVLISFWQPPKV